MAVTTTKHEATPLENNSKAAIKAARKRDALALAHLIYDIYKEELSSGKIVNGQNDAIQKPNN